MLNDPVSVNDSEQYVQRCEGQMVDRIEGGERQVIDRSNDSPFPEVVYFGNSDCRDAAVPHAEVQFDRNWHLGIERVAPPLPVPKACHGRDMIGILIIFIAAGLRSNRCSLSARFFARRSLTQTGKSVEFN